MTRQAKDAVSAKVDEPRPTRDRGCPAPTRLTRRMAGPTRGAAGTEAVEARGPFLVWYGDWTGPVSAGLIRVGRTRQRERPQRAEVLEGVTPP